MSLQAVGNFLSKVGGSNTFGAVTGIFGAAASLYGIITSIIDYAQGTPPEPSTQDVLDAIDRLELRIDDLAVELRQQIDAAIAGVQKQALLGAVARAESVHDILSSYDSNPDAVPSSNLISEASLALRDTLAQALVVAQSQTLASDATAAEVELAFSQVGVAIGAVTLALAVRAEVATRLEADEINAARIQTQFADAADFLSGAGVFLRNAIKADYRETSLGVVQVDLIGPPSIIDRMNNAEPGFEIPVSKVASAEVFIDSTDYDRATWENADWGTQDPLPYGPTYRLDPDASTQFLTNIVADFSTVINKSREQIHEIIGAIFEIDLEDGLLGAAGFGEGGEFLEDLAGFYREQADGVEKVLLPRIGMDDSGVLDGTAGNDLLVGGPGDDLLNGLGDNDILRGGDGNDTLNGGADNDRLYGEGGNDQLFGGAGDDGLTGGAGDDLIDGGEGFDSALFAGRRADYTVTSSAPTDPGSGPIEIFVSGPDGNDTLVSVERLFFDNVTINLVSGDDTLGDVLTGDFSVQIIADQFLNTVTENRPSDDIIYGFGGDDHIDGLSGNDVLYGGDGNDTLIGGAGNDTLEGGDGHDTLMGGSGNDLLVGGAGSNNMTGGAGDDVIDGTAGNDSAVFSGNRADYAFSVDGERVLVDGPDGHDTTIRVEALVFDDEFVRVRTGTDGADVLATEQVFFPQSRDILLGLGGDDSLSGGGGDDILVGGDGDDTLDGGDGGDILDGGDGIDTASYADSNARVVINLGLSFASIGHAAGDSFVSIENVIGSAFNDRIVGDSGANVLTGGDGLDELRGEAGDDTLLGGDGDDMLTGGDGGDVLDGGDGIDTASYASSSARVVVNLGLDYAASGHAAGDSFVSIENVIGSQFNDRIAGSETANVLHGGEGNDYLRGEAGDDELHGGSGDDMLLGSDGDDLLIGWSGADLLDGGNGSDTASYEGSNARVVINLGLNYASSGHAQGDSFVSVENVIGSAFNDRIVGDGGPNVLSGGDGNDYLRGDAGNDTLFGGNGDDLFAFGAGDGDDEIGDFVVGSDYLVLNGIIIDSIAELDGNGDSIMDTLVTFSSGDTVLLAGVTGVTDPGDLIA